MRDAVGGAEARRLPLRAGQQADLEVDARALVPQRVKAPLGQPAGDRDERVGALAPLRHRIGLVEPQHVQQLVLELGQRLLRFQSGMHEVGPGLRRAGQDRPVELAAADDLAGLADRGQAIAARAHRVQIVEQPGSDRARQGHRGAAQLAQREDPVTQPGRHELERVVRRMLHAGALDPRVKPREIDELGALFVGAVGDRPDEPFLAGPAGQRHDLTGLEVGAEVDCELGETGKGHVVHGTATIASATMQPCRTIATSSSPSTARLKPHSRSNTPSPSPRSTGHG